MSWRMSAVLLVTLAVSACQTTQGRINEYPSGKVVRSTIEVDTMQIPLPEGEWIVAGTEQYNNNVRTPIGRLVLLQLDKKKVKMAVYVTASLGYGGGGYVIKSTCERRDMLHVQKVANYGGGEQDCWWIKHVQPRFTSSDLSKKAFAEADQFMKSRGLTMPLNAIDVGYRFASESRLLDVDYYVNPEVEGIAPSVHAARATSDWHRDRLAVDPAKVAYVEKLKTWGAEWYEKVRLGFYGKSVVRGS